MGFHYLSVKAQINDREKSNEVLLVTKRDRPLTIEGIPDQRKKACIQPGYDSLYWANCQGNIRIIPH